MMVRTPMSGENLRENLGLPIWVDESCSKL